MSVLDLTNDSFNNEVLKYNGKVLVDFNANWCGPCRMLKPILEEVSSEFSNVKFASVNVDDCEILSMQYGISSIPCLILFDNGKEIKRSIGLISKEELIGFIGD